MTKKKTNRTLIMYYLRRTNRPRNSNKLNMSRLQPSFSLIVIVKHFDRTAISRRQFHWFDNCSSFIFERDSRKSLVVGRAVLEYGILRH